MIGVVHAFEDEGRQDRIIRSRANAPDLKPTLDGALFGHDVGDAAKFETGVWQSAEGPFEQ
jgi:hypothetical protein